jgi:hypothetical protein
MLSGMTDFRPIGLTLSESDYQRLKRYAESRYWSMALAARLIVVAELDRSDAAEGASAS